MIPSLSLLKNKLTVEAHEDGQVSVTVILPRDLIRSYCLFFDSLGDLFRFAQRQGDIDKALINSRELSQEAESSIAAYQDRIVKVFDAYTARGFDLKGAIADCG